MLGSYLLDALLAHPVRQVPHLSPTAVPIAGAMTLAQLHRSPKALQFDDASLYPDAAPPGCSLHPPAGPHGSATRSVPPICVAAHSRSAGIPPGPHRVEAGPPGRPSGGLAPRSVPCRVMGSEYRSTAEPSNSPVVGVELYPRLGPLPPGAHAHLHSAWVGFGFGGLALEEQLGPRCANPGGFQPPRQELVNQRRGLVLSCGPS